MYPLDKAKAIALIEEFVNLLNSRRDLREATKVTVNQDPEDENDLELIVEGKHWSEAHRMAEMLGLVTMIDSHNKVVIF